MLKGLLLLAVATALVGCATVAWYGQAARGQFEILAKREDIAEKIADPATPPDLRERLELVLAMREFATDELGLPESRSYRLYADLGREAPLWNVVATPRFSVAPETWCYPLVGCLAYRGYFRRERAVEFAGRLADEGKDVAVFPATAYSTLGWFADPVLDSMLSLSEARLADLIFHELTHELLYVPGDTAFNEAFATFVGRLGTRRWLEDQGEGEALEQWHEAGEIGARLSETLLAARERLAEGFARHAGVEENRAHKRAVLTRLDDELARLAERYDSPRIEAWRSREINNAHLALVATYESGVAAFESLHAESCGGEITCVYDHARRLADAAAAERAAFLSAGH